MPTKTIYVSDEDKQTFDKAKELAGKNLSAIIVEALRDYIDKQRAESDQYEEVRFVTGSYGTNGEKRFWGKLILEWRGYDEERNDILSLKAYRTRKNQIAATVEYRDPINDLWNTHHAQRAAWGVTRKLYVAKDAAEFANVLPEEPAKALRDAAKNDESPIEILDI